MHPINNGKNYRRIYRTVISPIKQWISVWGKIDSVGFKQVGIPYDRNARISSKSKFKSGDMFNLTMDEILNH